MNAVHSIIINSLEQSNQEYWWGWKIAYGMIDRLKKNSFHQSGKVLLNILE